MMNGLNLPRDYYEEPDEIYIYRDMGTLEMIREEFCKTADIDSTRLQSNPEILRDIIIRTDERKLYFHIFHNGMEPNEYKTVALLIFWILKLRPFWLPVRGDFTREQFQFAAGVNEKFCIFLVKTLLETFHGDICDTVAADSYLREMEYSFRFRDISKEALYLMLDPFYHFSFTD